MALARMTRSFRMRPTCFVPTSSKSSSAAVRRTTISAASLNSALRSLKASSARLPAWKLNRYSCPMSSDEVKDAPATDTGPSPLPSVHTTTFPAILDQLRSALFVTTYQAGKLVILRSDAGVINTHFRAFNKPMGMATAPGRLASGTAVDVWEFRNVPAVAAKLNPPSKHDACYLPRAAHVT